MEKKNILLIDNSQVLVDINKKILERAGYSVRCAIGAAGAREQLKVSFPDGIVLGNELPDSEGLDFCRELLETMTVPILFISGNKEDELPALQAGANDFLKKPFDYDILKVRIKNMLKEGNSQGTDDSDENAFNQGQRQSREKKTAESTADHIIPLPIETVHKTKKIRIPVAAGILFILIGSGMYAHFKLLPDYYTVADVSVPLAFTPELSESPDIYGEDKIELTEGPGYMIPQYDQVSLLADSTKVPMLLYNPADNQCYFIFEIVIANTEEVLYRSNVVAPGKYIDNIIINRKLPIGEYKANLIISAYGMENLNEMDGVTIEFNMIVV